MKSVFIVVGECGEYEDKEWWIVAALSNEEMAKSFVEVCRNEASRINEEVSRENKVGENFSSYENMIKDKKVEPHKYDKKYQYDYHVTYNYEKVNLLENKLMEVK